MFKECGILLKKDGSDSHLIKIPGLDNYKIDLNQP